MFPFTQAIARLSAFRALALIAALIAVGCGSSSPEDKVADEARSLVDAFKTGDHQKVCEKLTTQGQKSLVEAALKRDPNSANLSDCAAASRYLLDGTPSVGRNTLDVEGSPKDVDITADGARVGWECCSFQLEEVGGSYVVSEASALGLYFDVAGAGAGAGGGSPAAQPTKETVDLIRESLRASARTFPEQHFNAHVTDIRVAGPRATLVTDIDSNDNRTIGVCRAAVSTSTSESPAIKNLPGISQLLIKSADGKTLDCAELIR